MYMKVVNKMFLKYLTRFFHSSIHLTRLRRESINTVTAYAMRGDLNTYDQQYTNGSTTRPNSICNQNMLTSVSGAKSSKTHDPQTVGWWSTEPKKSSTEVDLTPSFSLTLQICGEDSRVWYFFQPSNAKHNRIERST